MRRKDTPRAGPGELQRPDAARYGGAAHSAGFRPNVRDDPTRPVLATGHRRVRSQPLGLPEIDNSAEVRRACSLSRPHRIDVRERKRRSARLDDANRRPVKCFRHRGPCCGISKQSWAAESSHWLKTPLFTIKPFARRQQYCDPHDNSYKLSRYKNTRLAARPKKPQASTQINLARAYIYMMSR